MRRVGVLTFATTRLFDLAVATEVWGLDRTHMGVPHFDFGTFGPSKRLRAGQHLAGRTTGPLNELRTCDLVIVPGIEQPTMPVPKAVRAALVDAWEQGATLASLCSGAFVLAATGLLDNEVATVHWQDAPALHELHPNVRIDRDRLFVGHNRIWTSAGTAAGIDLCLHLLRTDHGATVAAQVARSMVTAPFRRGGQKQFSGMPLSAPESPTLLEALADATRKRLHEHWTVPDLAKLVGLSPRTFARRFQHETGNTPAQWLIHQRVLAAQSLLENTDLNVTVIARRCGFATPLSLRTHFHRALGVHPHQYRLNFQQPSST